MITKEATSSSRRRCAGATVELSETAGGQSSKPLETRRRRSISRTALMEGRDGGGEKERERERERHCASVKHNSYIRYRYRWRLHNTPPSEGGDWNAREQHEKQIYFTETQRGQETVPRAGPPGREHLGPGGARIACAAERLRVVLRLPDPALASAAIDITEAGEACRPT